MHASNLAEYYPDLLRHWKAFLAISANTSEEILWKIIDYSVKLASRMMQSYTLPEAIAYYTYALELIDKMPPSSRGRQTARILMSQVPPLFLCICPSASASSSSSPNGSTEP